MEKLIYDESNGLWYELQGDYYLPCLTLPTEEEHRSIGSNTYDISSSISECFTLIF